MRLPCAGLLIQIKPSGVPDLTLLVGLGAAVARYAVH